MITLIRHNNTRSAATDKEYPTYLAQPHMARVMDQILIVEEEAVHGPDTGEDGEDGDDGDDGDDHDDVAIAMNDLGYGLNNMDPGAIVDAVLADLPEPSRHHILPQLEEYGPRARPALIC